MLSYEAPAVRSGVHRPAEPDPAVDGRPNGEAITILAQARRDRERSEEIREAWDAAVRRLPESHG